MAAAETITVEVVHAGLERQVLIEVSLPAGSTVADALRESGVAGALPDVDLAASVLGVFGKRCSVRRVLAPGDRVEIYRPLCDDPRAIRRRRAGG